MMFVSIINYLRVSQQREDYVARYWSRRVRHPHKDVLTAPAPATPQLATIQTQKKNMCCFQVHPILSLPFFFIKFIRGLIHIPSLLTTELYSAIEYYCLSK